MSVVILTADEAAFLLPTHFRTDVGSGVAEGETTAAAVRFICLGAVKQKIGVEAAFAGAEDVVDRGAILLRVLDALVKGVVFLWGTLAPSEVAMVVGTGEETHACVLGVSTVDRKPAGNGLAGGERPIAGVLMPGNAFAVSRHFAKKMGSPADNLRPQQIINTGDDAGVGEEIINAAIF